MLGFRPALKYFNQYNSQKIVELFAHPLQESAHGIQIIVIAGLARLLVLCITYWAMDVNLPTISRNKPIFSRTTGEFRFGENMLRNIKGLILCVSLETPDVLIALIQVMRLYTEMETH